VSSSTRRADVGNTLCAYCGVVLQVEHPTDGSAAIVRKSTGDKTHPANFGRLCTKGLTAAYMLAGPGRLPRRWCALTEGLNLTTPTRSTPSGTLRRNSERSSTNGPDTFAMYVSGQRSMEAHPVEQTRQGIHRDQPDRIELTAQVGASPSRHSIRRVGPIPQTSTAPPPSTYPKLHSTNGLTKAPQRRQSTPGLDP
jgi:hypothetical protein